MSDFELVEKGNELIFEKVGFDFKNDEGLPILGWVLKKHLLLWINHNSGAGNIYRVEDRPEINPEHVTLYLYKDGKETLIGWMDKKRIKELDDRLWDYFKTKIADRVVEVEKKKVEKMKTEKIAKKAEVKVKQKIEPIQEQMCLFG